MWIKFFLIMLPLVVVFAIVGGIVVLVDEDKKRKAAGRIASVVLLGLVETPNKTSTVSAVSRGLVGGVVGGAFGAAVGIATAKEKPGKQLVKFYVTYESGFKEVEEVEVGGQRFNELMPLASNV